MYKCRICGNEVEDPVVGYEKDGGSITKCGRCGSEDLTEDDAVCKRCGAFLYEGERAYEIGDDLYCRKCVSEVLI